MGHGNILDTCTAVVNFPFGALVGVIRYSTRAVLLES